MAKGSEHGNTLWNPDTIYAEVQSILVDILQDKGVVYLGEVFETRNYSRQRFSEWEKEYRSHKGIADTISQIKTILESRINVGGVKNLLNPAMVKFNLINNYDWKDKSEQDMNLGNKDGETLKIDTTNITNELLDEHLQKYLQK